MESRAVEEHVDAILKHTKMILINIFNTAPPSAPRSRLGLRHTSRQSSVLHMLSSTIESVYYERAPIKKTRVLRVYCTYDTSPPRPARDSAGPAPRIPCNIS
jgi:hypothetical protein